MQARVDVGGAFTDLVLLAADGAVRLAKTPTTPENQAFGVLSALQAADVAPAALSLIVHGTTTTTNAVIERRFARTGLITTEGFRDVLELGRRTRPRPYGMTGVFEPVIPRDLRMEVPGRIDPAGEIVTPLDEAAVADAVRALLAAGCEALAIHFLHAYANPAHEARAGAIARALWPNPYVTCGHELLSESREFERGVTAAVNAGVRPLLDRYLARLQDTLAARGYARVVLVMSGDGGMVSARHVAQEAAKTVMSGPASGVIAAAHLGRRAGLTELITYDMGGTSTDVALIRGAEPAVSAEIEVDYALPIHVPMVDVRTVGAGGGSVLWIDAAGLLRVGPESAGARPGPICFGRGGTRPTVSDANLLLGRPNPRRLHAVDGAPPVDAGRAVFAGLGRSLGLDAEGAAAAAVRVADDRMAGAIRMVSLSLGADPRDFALFAFGGAGPLHACALARELGLPRVLVPARPGVINALGCVVADLRRDYVATLNRPRDAVDMDRVHAVLAAQEAQGRAAIAAEAVALAGVRAIRWADMQFVGQTHLLRVPLESATPSRAALGDGFAAAYLARFGVALEIRANLVNLGASVVGARPAPDLSRRIDPAGRAATLAPEELRPLWFPGGWRETPVHLRDRLPADATLTGPAVVEQMDATTVLHPGDVAAQDGDGNLIVTVGA